MHIFISSKDAFLEPTWWRKLDNSDEHLSHKFWSCLWSLNSLSYPSPFSVTCCKMYITVHFWQLCTVMPAVWNPSAGLSCYKSRWYSEKGKRNQDLCIWFPLMPEAFVLCTYRALNETVFQIYVNGPSFRKSMLKLKLNYFNFFPPILQCC